MMVNNESESREKVKEGLISLNLLGRYRTCLQHCKIIRIPGEIRNRVLKIQVRVVTALQRFP